MDRQKVCAIWTEMANRYEEDLPGAAAVLHCLAGAVEMGEERTLALHCAKFAQAAIIHLDEMEATQTDMAVD